MVPLCLRHHRMVHNQKTNAPVDVTTGTLVKEGHAIARGDGVWIGRPPYGYEMRRDGKLQDIPMEQSALRFAEQARAEGWTYDRIASALNRWGFRRRDATQWTRHSAHKVFRDGRDWRRPTAKDPEVPIPPPIPVVDHRFLPGQKTLPIVEAL